MECEKQTERTLRVGLTAEGCTGGSGSSEDWVGLKQGEEDGEVGLDWLEK